MDLEKDISRLNRALVIYSDIVRFGLRSIRMDESELCLQILEEFEEYEKCYDIFLIISGQSEGMEDKISRKKKNGH